MELRIQGIGTGGINPSARTVFTKLKSYFELLGNDQHILIRYISGMIAATNVTMLDEAASYGFDVADQLHQICTDLLDKHGANPEYHEYYTAISAKRDLFSIYPTESTVQSLYYLELFDLHAELSVNEYILRQEKNIREFAGLPEVGHYYEILEQKLGAAAKELNDLLLEHFVCARVMDAFRQGMLNEYHYTLENVDPDTQQPIFQLWMETL